MAKMPIGPIDKPRPKPDQETDIDIMLPKPIKVDLTVPVEYVVHHYHHFANPLTLNIPAQLTHVKLTLTSP